MREVEVKAHLRNKEELLGKLTESGAVFAKSVTQNDTVFVRDASTMEKFLGNDCFLRIRETPESIIFTLKYHPNRTGNGNALAMPLEHELTVSNKKELEEMLRLMGFVPALVINKTRESCHVGDFEICVDEVEDLGSFIEVERLTEHEEEVEPVIKDMKEFLCSLGVAESDMGVKRYDIQLLEKQFGTN
ncbi:MAG: class IV adenylate cyclase [Patescibacteria group bacterium]